MTKEERLAAQKQKLIEMKLHENDLREKGVKCIAGIDEVGRGPLAGPVYAACVVLPKDFDVIGINDSKKLSAKKREELSEVILDKALAVGIGIASNDEIDSINILNATKKAMLMAVDEANNKLEKSGNDSIDILLIDAVKLDTDIRQESIIKGDEKSLSIAAASIVAKVARDSFMVEMDTEYPGYAFASNKGYGTEAHYEGLRELGFTPIHRRTFLKKFEEAEKDMKNAKKVYAVKNGRNSGIYYSWDDCKKEVDGFPGANYKSFSSVKEANEYLGLSTKEDLQESKDTHGNSITRAYVDGSYDVSTGRYGSGAVILHNGEVIELSEMYDDEQSKLRNVAGEIRGAVLAINFCHRNGIKKVTIYHDYEGVGKWGDNLWKANLPMTIRYKEFIVKARKEMEITFVKVEAHSGDKYNDMADKLAKAALGI
jgi:ribonuclease HII/ribonuclease HI